MCCCTSLIQVLFLEVSGLGSQPTGNTKNQSVHSNSQDDDYGTTSVKFLKLLTIKRFLKKAPKKMEKFTPALVVSGFYFYTSHSTLRF